MANGEIYGPPTPQQSVNSASGGSQSFLDRLLDGGTLVLSRLGAIELERVELERLGKLRAAEAAANNERQDQLSGRGNYSTQEKAIIGTSSILSIAMLAAAAFLIARR